MTWVGILVLLVFFIIICWIASWLVNAVREDMAETIEEDKERKLQ